VTEPTPIRPPEGTLVADASPHCPLCAGLEARIWTLLEETDQLSLLNLELTQALTAVRGQLADAQAALVRAGKRDART